MGYLVNYPTRNRRQPGTLNKNRVVSFVNQPMTLYHGTNRSDFTEFDMSHVEPFNIGLHFGTRAAAESRIAYLREENPSASCRILTCELTFENPLRVDDVFGHSYARLFEVLEREIGWARTSVAPFRRSYETLLDSWMAADDNPRFMKDPALYEAFNRKLNVEIRRLFQKLGYDGFVYRNELEAGESTADSYCVFDSSQVVVKGEEMVQYYNPCADRAA